MLIGKQLNIKVTDYCNASCSFCGYNKNSLKKKIKNGYKPFVLDVDSFRKRYRALRQKGINKLHLTGGEPFMHPLIRELLLSAKEAGFTINIGTNGSLLNENLVAFLNRSKVDYFWLSIDTYPIEKHLEHRGFLHITDKFINGIKLLKKYDINFFCQTVISHVLPKKNGKLDLKGHIDYYYQKFGINRFVFSYPMYRPETSSKNAHMISFESDNVKFSRQELCEIYEDIIQIKRDRKNIIIVNPLVSLWQQLNELNSISQRFGCYAGRDIFYLGKDQKTLRPCYYFADKIVDRIDENPLKFDDSYETCLLCQDGCFRDPSVMYYAKHYPFKLLIKLLINPKLFKYTINDLMDIFKNGMYRLPPKNSVRNSGRRQRTRITQPAYH